MSSDAKESLVTSTPALDSSEVELLKPEEKSEDALVTHEQARKDAEKVLNMKKLSVTFIVVLTIFVGCGKNGISNSPVSETKNESGEKEICYIDYDSSLNGVL
ncbi:MAG: hypothetical protein IKR27_05295, partial [Lachnospiraceae bacterium]|nr:hypothetical protein [Lachnospiraceae bacterium]